MIYGSLVSAYRNGHVDEFNKVIREYDEYLERTIPKEVNRTRLEFLFNQVQPFLQAMVVSCRPALRPGLLAQVAENTWRNCFNSASVCISHTHSWAYNKNVFTGPASRKEPLQLGDFRRLGIRSPLPVSRTLLHERHWQRLRFCDRFCNLTDC